MLRLFTVSRMMEPGTDVSFTWQLRPPHEEKTFSGTLTPGRTAYSLSTHSEPERVENTGDTGFDRTNRQKKRGGAGTYLMQSGCSLNAEQLGGKEK